MLGNLLVLALEFESRNINTISYCIPLLLQLYKFSAHTGYKLESPERASMHAVFGCLGEVIGEL